MKRYLIRSAVLLVVVTGGILAVAQGQRILKRREMAAATASGSKSAPQSGDPAPGEGLTPPDKSPLWESRTPTAESQSIAAAAEQAVPVGYTESSPSSASATVPDTNVLQAVAEADLSPTPVEGNARANTEPTSQSMQLAPDTVAPPAQLELTDSARAQLQNHESNGYLPARMAAEPAGANSAQMASESQAAGDQSPLAAEPDGPPLMNNAPGTDPEPTPADPVGNAFAPPEPATGEPAGQDLSAANVAVSEGTGRPGGRELEGVQAASLSVEKLAPAELQVGRNATFQIKVRNTGTAPAKDVQVIDTLPKGARLANTNPPAEQNPNGEIVWNLGRLRPGEETVVNLEIVPLTEGEIGSIAVARFTAEASARTVATRPQLSVQVSGPRDVLVGQEGRFLVRVANVGSGAANAVTLLDQLPPNFTHPAGHEVEYSVGLLGPNESREVELILTAAKPGKVQHTILAYADGNLRAEDRSDVEVLAPSLALTIQGSERRFLERQAVYTVALANPGTAPARSVELNAQLPEGLQFVEANNLGEYDAATRTVHWRLDELPTGQSGSVTLITMPSAEGESKLVVGAKANQGATAEKTQRVIIEGVAGTSFEVVDVNDPIELNGETTYEIRVTNQGTKAATNVRVAMLVPDGMKPVDAQGPTAHLFDGGQITFEPLARLAPKADTTYQVRVQSSQSGDMRVRVQLLSDEMRTPVTKEESTRVFGNE